MRRASSISALLYGLRRGPKPSSRVNAIRCYCDRAVSSSRKLAGPLTQYRILVEKGKLQHDPNQEAVASQLENLLGRLEKYERDMEEYHTSLANWEKKRENERRRILMEEAEGKQKDDSGNNQGNKVFGRWMSKKRPENVEPGVGKWVSYLKQNYSSFPFVGSTYENWLEHFRPTQSPNNLSPEVYIS
ncbi:hypothetical protein ACLB2K_030140 [Fragaria x ananassa]